MFEGERFFISNYYSKIYALLAFDIYYNLMRLFSDIDKQLFRSNRFSELYCRAEHHELIPYLYIGQILRGFGTQKSREKSYVQSVSFLWSRQIRPYKRGYHIPYYINTEELYSLVRM